MPGARTKLLSLFEKNLNKPLSKEVLRREAGISEWARMIRALRQEGYQIELLKDGSYVLNSATKKEGNKRDAIDRKTRYRILQRDNSTCQRCGRSIKDSVKLDIDHKIPVEWGGKTADDNLWTLCEECNEGKKHWLKDENVAEMKRILEIKGTIPRLNAFFELHPNELLEIGRLSVIGGTREWTRAIRFVREKYEKKIVYVRKDAENDKEGYVYEKS